VEAKERGVGWGGEKNVKWLLFSHKYSKKRFLWDLGEDGNRADVAEYIEEEGEGEMAKNASFSFLSP